MKTFPLPPLTLNYNKQAFFYAFLVYSVLILGAYLILKTPSTSTKNVSLEGSAIVLKLSNITKNHSNQTSKHQSFENKTSKQVPMTPVKSIQASNNDAHQKPKKNQGKIKPQKSVAKKERHMHKSVPADRQQATVKNYDLKNNTQKVLAQSTNINSAKVQSSSTSIALNKSSNAQLQLNYGHDTHPILSSIKQAIDNALIYPRKARKMRHQGQAIVSFKYHQRKLQQVRLVKSSGSALLDKAALNTIYKAATFFPTIKESLEITIPIEFKLH